ncbi:hypothetical protein DPMN_151659 [Dreissena polymorpha]|uniref:Uncharacterized protein n=1 Tax=Dreissena polymorpha TaxID=45954 RepID=A0A9D4FFG9_DREPO|nr:hypothetical protein DPMN_151659 [Dreissena polymorpha]
MGVSPEVLEIPEATNNNFILSELSADSRSDEVEDRTFNITHQEKDQLNVYLTIQK